ncbi:bifunctional biotin--[acetyl-CoA-carboxylase] ligase/biotin operon repressor BirA [Gammaproteobacteria bacterium LSUCC0112]|nr:bifunctional biotin--[acetyl-CoA-carboxylase] ligase/biotin operon repressor BirA [Gammaproteobacteria bacterium LSUCC0112]
MNVVPLLTLLSDGSFHSGEALGSQLGISRAAVWKQIKSLRDLGVSVHAVTGKGYRVAGGIQLLDKDQMIANLYPGVAEDLDGFDVHFSIGSTNTEAMRRGSESFSSYLVMAEHQSQGRGRRGRSWVSPFGHNLYLSLLWSFQGGIAALEGLSLLCALAVIRTLKKLSYEGMQVKWPNDVLYKHKKLAGILLEVSGDVAGPCKLVIGIGLNTDMPVLAGKNIDQPYSDLRTVKGALEDRNLIAATLVSELILMIRQFEISGFKPFVGEWMASDAFLGRNIEVRSALHVQAGVCAGVDETGRLLLESGDGCIAISGGEVMPSVRAVGAN